MGILPDQSSRGNTFGEMITVWYKHVKRCYRARSLVQGILAVTNKFGCLAEVAIIIRVDCREQEGLRGWCTNLLEKVERRKHTLLHSDAFSEFEGRTFLYGSPRHEMTPWVTEARVAGWPIREKDEHSVTYRMKGANNEKSSNLCDGYRQTNEFPGYREPHSPGVPR